MGGRANQDYSFLSNGGRLLEKSGLIWFDPVFCESGAWTRWRILVWFGFRESKGDLAGEIQFDPVSFKSGDDLAGEF